MAKMRSRLCCAVLMFAVTACASRGACYPDDTPPGSLRTIYVVQRGWHTGIVVAVADWPNRRWSLLDEFAQVDFLEFGWGDERFYQAEENTVWLGSRAALWPSSSVIHVIGHSAPITGATARVDRIVRVQVSLDALRELTSGIEREYGDQHPIASGPQVHWAPAPNRFYAAKRSFFFPRMCNWWIATRLEQAGCPIRPWSVVTARRLIHKARGFAGAEEIPAHTSASPALINGHRRPPPLSHVMALGRG